MIKRQNKKHGILNNTANRPNNPSDRIIKVVFAGNPNVGKSSWINQLSGAHLTIGNYPGVTVEKKEAHVRWKGLNFHLIDLPGLYSLYHSVNEETISRDILLEEHIDVIVNVIDTTNFIRNCELMLQLRELQIPMLVLLNFKDEAIHQNIVIELEKLQQLLSLRVILCSAHDGDDQNEVKDAILWLAQQKRNYQYPYYFSPAAETVFNLTYTFIQSLFTSYQQLDSGLLALYALKWCEQEPFFVEKIKQLGLPLHNGYELLEAVSKTDLLDHRNVLKHGCLQCIHIKTDHRLYTTKRIDRFVLHRYGALPLFFLLMAALFSIVFLVSQPLTLWLDQFINEFVVFYAGRMLSFLPDVLRLFILKGIIKGVGAVLVFLPMLASLFFLLALLEESGYFARVAFLFDRIMRPFGMSGRSFVSLLLGFGCNVPAILSTRTLHEQRSRWITALTIPLMSCSARLPIYLVFAYAFFPNKFPLVVMVLYALGSYIAVLMALFLNYFAKKQRSVLFTIELPPYRWPSMHLLLRKVKIELSAFVRKSLTVIMSSMMVLFIVSYFPSGKLNNSYLFRFAETVAPFFEPLGFGDQPILIAALPGAIISKENVVGFLNQTLVQKEEKPLLRTLQYDLRKQVKWFGTAVKQTILWDFGNSKSSTSLVRAVGNLWDDPLRELRAFSYLVFLLLSIPCVMTLHTLYREYGWKMLVGSLLLMMILPYVVSLLLFQGLSRVY